MHFQDHFGRNKWSSIMENETSLTEPSLRMGGGEGSQLYHPPVNLSPSLLCVHC